MKTVTEVLKSSCRKAHIKTEKTLVDKLKSLNNLNDYINILTTFYGYFTPLENKIEKYFTPKLLPDIVLRKRSLFILSDLHKLQYTIPLSLACELPPISNFQQAAGAMYVLEGSTLGGQHIAQMLSAKPILHERKDAMTFFRGYEDKTARMWQVFKDLLDTHVEEENAEAVVQSAIQTFVLLDKWTSNKHNDRNTND